MHVHLCNHYLDTIMFRIFKATNLDTDQFQFWNIVEDVYWGGVEEQRRKYIAGQIR